MTLEHEIFTQACRLHFGITTQEQKDALEKLALLVGALQHETAQEKENDNAKH